MQGAHQQLLLYYYYSHDNQQQLLRRHVIKDPFSLTSFYTIVESLRCEMVKCNLLSFDETLRRCTALVSRKDLFFLDHYNLVQQV